MLSDKMEKRIASSIFITLAPPRRDLCAKSDAKPAKAPLLPSNSLPRATSMPSGPVPPETSMGPIVKVTRARGRPNGGCSELPPPAPPPILRSDPREAALGALLPPPPAPYSNPVLVETLGPDLQKQTTFLPSSSLQTSSTFPAEQRQPKLRPSTLGWADEHQMEMHVEDTVPREICAFCHKAIPAQAPALEAMNKQYHANCFTCRMCQCTLAGQHYYQKEGRPLCVACYQNTLEKCAFCQGLILDQIVRALGNRYHPDCFTCVVCGRAIGDETFAVDDDNRVHCLEDFYRKFASMCGSCGKLIIPNQGQDSYRIECMGRHFHEDCYRCEGSLNIFTEEGSNVPRYSSSI
ncbi:filamin-binding LIM protein 1 isoform X2 [Sceloporus undulatus]|uniref:filamin-binding LIM protein 1 isoform X2 n=1 Tax=Sceloporus undulatus TaxID=8520 RepID=UPI001C4CF0B8|nr:filamin-binding LIM protein 1 isoform X2 [Sceloporus undulatus]